MKFPSKTQIIGAMRLSAEGEELIKEWEGARGRPRGRAVLKAYKCPAGIWTIGWGHTGPDVYEGLVIDATEAEALFKTDVRRFERCVNETCPIATQPEFDAMVALCFNIGEGAYPGKKGKPGFRTSSVARLHNAERHGEAAQAFALWNKCNGVVNDGLVARRAEEAARYREGVTDNEAHEGPPDMPQAIDGEGESSRTIKGATTAGGAILAGPLLEHGKGFISSLTDYHDQVMELMPYFDGMKWALLAIAVAGIVGVVYARLHDRSTGRS